MTKLYVLEVVLTSEHFWNENVPNYPVMNLILFFIYKHTQLISVSVNCIPVYGNLFIIKPYNYALLGRCNVNNTLLYVGPIM